MIEEASYRCSEVNFHVDTEKKKIDVFVAIVNATMDCKSVEFGESSHNAEHRSDSRRINQAINDAA